MSATAKRPPTLECGPCKGRTFRGYYTCACGRLFCSHRGRVDAASMTCEPCAERARGIVQKGDRVVLIRDAQTHAKGLTVWTVVAKSRTTSSLSLLSETADDAHRLVVAPYDVVLYDPAVHPTEPLPRKETP